MKEVIDATLFGTVLVTLTVIMDPVGNVPLFLSLTAGRSNRKRRKLAAQAVLVSLGVISVFAVLGQQILDYLGISIPALQGAGGLLLMIVALVGAVLVFMGIGIAPAAAQVGLAEFADATRRPHGQHTTVVVHVDVEQRAAALHLGPLLTDAERQYLTCDATYEVWFERHGDVIGAGRTTRQINRRLRRARSGRRWTPTSSICKFAI